MCVTKCMVRMLILVYVNTECPHGDSKLRSQYYYYYVCRVLLYGTQPP